MGRDTTLMARGERWHRQRGLARWLAIGLGGALLLALLFAQAARATSHTATLETLNLSGITPVLMEFASGTVEYDVTVSDTPNTPVESTTVLATLPAADQETHGHLISPADADDKAGHQVALGVGKTVIEVEVWSEDRVTVTTYTVTVTRVAASDASLKSLKVNELSAAGEPVELSPGFAAGTTTYEASVKHDLDSGTGGFQSTVTVSPEALNGNAEISVPGSTETVVSDGPNTFNVVLSVGDNVIPVTVVAPDGSSTSYRLNIAREGNTNLSATEPWTMSPGTAPPITPDAGSTTMYSVTVLAGVEVVTVAANAADVTVPAADDDAKVEIISPADADGTAIGHQVALEVGKNPIMATVTAKDGSSETYTLTITRTAPAVNLALTSLTLGAEVRDTDDLENKTRHTHTVSDSSTAQVDEISVNAESTEGSDVALPSDANSQVPGNQVRLGVGSTTFTITVTQSGARQVHTVVVTRVAASDASLKSLKVNELSAAGEPVELSPGFAAGTTTYEASVKHDLDSGTGGFQSTVTVSPEALNGNAEISVPGSTETVVSDGPNTFNVVLSVGDNVIPVAVVAPDGTPKTYTLTISREGDTALDALDAWSVTAEGTGVIDVALTAGSTTEYTASVAESVAEVTVAANPADVTDPAADDDAKAEIISPADADADTDMHQVELAVGKNPIMATVTAKDGSSKTYTLTITRTKSSTSLLIGMTGLSVNGVDVAGFDDEVTEYEVPVLAHVEVATIGTTPTMAGAVVTIEPQDADPDTKGHQVALEGGKNEVKVMVMSSDGSTITTYTLEIFRPTINEHLTALSLAVPGTGDDDDIPVTLFPEFDKGITSYMASVGTDVNLIVVTQKASPNATSTVTPEDSNDTNVDVHDVNLMLVDPGKTQEISVEVVSSDGTSSTVYTVTVLKLHAMAQLTKLSLGDDVKLSPKFNGSTTTHYSADAEYATEQVTVAAEAMAGATAVITQVDADADADGHQVNLDVGMNSISVEVTYGRGDEQQTTSYMVAVMREAAVEVEVEVPGPTVTVPGPTVTRTVTKTVEVPAPAPAQANVIGMTGSATATEVDGRVLITRHDGGASLMVDIGGFIRDADLGQTYQVVRRADGAIVRQWVSPNSPLVYQIPWAVVNTSFTVPVGVIGSIPLDDMAGAEGQLVRRFDGGDDRIFSYAMGQWRHVPDIATFQALGFYWCDVTAADASFFDRISMGAPYPASSTPARMDYPSCSTG